MSDVYTGVSAHKIESQEGDKTENTASLSFQSTSQEARKKKDKICPVKRGRAENANRNTDARSFSRQGRDSGMTEMWS